MSILSCRSSVHKIKVLTADRVDDRLEGLAEVLSTASPHKLHNSLKRAAQSPSGAPTEANCVAGWN